MVQRQLSQRRDKGAKEKTRNTALMSPTVGKPIERVRASRKGRKREINTEKVAEKSRYRTALEWEKRGVLVQRDPYDFPKEDRETIVGFINSQRHAEVITAEKSWMRRLESDGAVPETIQIFDQSEGESRFYVVPRGWVKKPYKSALSNPE